MIMAFQSNDLQPKKLLFLKTYGCQMNVYDSERIVHLLKEDNYQVTSDMRQADNRCDSSAVVVHPDAPQS